MVLADDRIQHLEAQVAQLQSNQASASIAAAATNLRVDQVHKVVSAEVQARAEVDVDPEYNRPPNGTLLRLHLEVRVPKDAVAVAVRGWIGDHIAEDQWQLEGPDAGHRYVLKFTSFPKSAALQLRKALDVLKPERSSDPWTDVMVTHDGQSHKL